MVTTARGTARHKVHTRWFFWTIKVATGAFILLAKPRETPSYYHSDCERDCKSVSNALDISTRQCAATLKRQRTNDVVAHARNLPCRSACSSGLCPSPPAFQDTINTLHDAHIVDAPMCHILMCPLVTSSPHLSYRPRKLKRETRTTHTRNRTTHTRNRKTQNRTRSYWVSNTKIQKSETLSHFGDTKY